MRQLLICVIMLFTVSCKKNNDTNNINLSQRLMTKVAGTSTGTINQKIDLTVTWPYASGCDVLDKFEESRNGNIIIIKAYGHVEQTVCTQEAGYKTKTYNFVSTTAGTFELRFTNSDNSYISHTVTIN